MIQAGSLDKSDVLITLEKTTHGGISLEIESKVKKLFGKQMEKTTRDTLKTAGVEHARVTLQDSGALDFILRARLKTALRQLLSEEGS